MLDILHILGELDYVEKGRCVNTMIRVIACERNITLEAVGQYLNPPRRQPTISKWLNGDYLPSDRYFAQLTRLFFGPWYYLCSFADTYEPSLAVEARQALYRARADTPLVGQVRVTSEPADEYDIRVRKARLVAGAWAHTFANHSHNPSVYVVLVRDDLPREERIQIGREEILAHVIQPKIRSTTGLNVATSLQQHFRDVDSDD